ncbi:hypothetical protein [Stackebrandtia albiflava]|nr:hypothetical protein [Stackebrandtia albiflava]
MGSRGARSVRAAGTVLAVTGIVTLVGGLLAAPASLAAQDRVAESTLVELTVTPIPVIPVEGFDGAYGTAGTPDTGAPSDHVDGDFSDPDGVLDLVTVNGTQVVETSWDAASGQLTTRGNATGFEFDYNGVDDFLTAGSVDSYARCVDGQAAALAYARTDAVQFMVLGQSIPYYVPTEIAVTGADLNMPGVAGGTVTVLGQAVENVVNEPEQTSAEAYLEYTATAELYDENGDLVYSGPLFDLTVGHVKVECQAPVDPQTPSETPTTPTDPPTTPTETPSESPSETPTSPTETPSESPSETPTTPTETPSESPSASESTPPTGPDTTPPAGGGPGDGLPVTGGPVGILLAAGTAATVSGLLLLWASRRRLRG